MTFTIKTIYQEILKNKVTFGTCEMGERYMILDGQKYSIEANYGHHIFENIDAFYRKYGIFK
ncbi:MAG: hypothetical protein WC523_04915 [Patescibacteria group bacterium]